MQTLTHLGQRWCTLDRAVPLEKCSQLQGIVERLSSDAILHELFFQAAHAQTQKKHEKQTNKQTNTKQ